MGKIASQHTHAYLLGLLTLVTWGFFQPQTVASIQLPNPQIEIAEVLQENTAAAPEALQEDTAASREVLQEDNVAAPNNKIMVLSIKHVMLPQVTTSDPGNRLSETDYYVGVISQENLNTQEAKRYPIKLCRVHVFANSFKGSLAPGGVKVLDI